MKLMLPAFVTLALILTACASDQGASPSGVAADTESQAAAESEAATESAGAAPSDGMAFPSFELPDSAPELAALLPDEIGGTEAVKFSYTGEELMSGEEEASVDEEFIEFLDRLGAEPEDISFAFALAMAGEATAGVVAFRIEGASEDELDREFRTVMDEEGQPVEWEETNLGGKDVVVADDPDNPGNRMWLYTNGDIIFLVTAADEEAAEELLETLP